MVTKELEELMGLKPGDDIQVRIRARNSNGWGRFSSNDKIEKKERKVPGRMIKP